MEPSLVRSDFFSFVDSYLGFKSFCMEVYAYAVEERTEATIWVLKEQQYIVAVVSFLRLK